MWGKIILESVENLVHLEKEVLLEPGDPRESKGRLVNLDFLGLGDKRELKVRRDLLGYLACLD